MSKAAAAPAPLPAPLEAVPPQPARAKRKVGFAPPPKPGAPKKRQKPDEKTEPAIQMTHTINELLGDVAMALGRVMGEIAGVERVITIKLSPFGPISIPFVDKHIMVPGGNGFTVPIGSYLVPALGRIMPKGGGTSSTLNCYPNEDGWDEELWKTICAHVEAEVKKGPSMFKQRAFKIEDEEDILFPEYLDLRAPQPLFFNADVQEHLDTALFSLIEDLPGMRAAGVPLKRGICLEGYYGTGKTSIALRSAQLAQERGITFISVSAGVAHQAIEIARRCSPTVLFIEDLDTAMQRDRRFITSLMNELSGIESRGTEVLLVVSTNFRDRIDPGMLRPDRIDTLITMTLPDPLTTARIVRHYSGRFLGVGVDLVEVAKSLEGSTPAIIGEAVNLAKIKAVRAKRDILPEDIIFFSGTLTLQKSLAKPEYREQKPSMTLAKSLYQVVADGEYY